ncbi:unknown [Bacteroides sp. CAG:1060]|nr:unknown [Bacteroides sp. CAG:1060]
MTTGSLLDEASYHHLRSIEVCNDTIAQRADGLHAGVDLLMHQFGLLTKSDAFPRIVIYCYDTRLVQDNLIILINDRVGRSEVNCQFLIKKRKCHFDSHLSCQKTKVMKIT